MRNPVRIWVHPDFKKAMKKEAADKEISVVKLSEKLTEHQDKIFPKKGRLGYDRFF